MIGVCESNYKIVCYSDSCRDITPFTNTDRIFFHGRRFKEPSEIPCFQIYLCLCGVFEDVVICDVEKLQHDFDEYHSADVYNYEFELFEMRASVST